MSKQKRGATVRVNLTKRSVAAFEIPAECYSTFYDEQVRDLGLVVPSSSKRSFFVIGKNNQGAWPKSRALTSSWALSSVDQSNISRKAMM
jgi:hypothetical protein